MDNLFNSLQPSDDSTLWRFMDLFKFVDLITSKELTLVNLTAMKDPYEGVLHSSIELQWTDLYGNPTGQPTGDINQVLNDGTRKILFISCWHENEFESAGMWDTYGSQNGIAIKTNVRKLKKSIQYHNYNEMDLLKVNYYKNSEDYFTPNRTPSHIYTGLVNKRISFEHEKEVRLIWHPRDYENQMPTVRKLNIDIKELIECIYLSPLFEQWQLNSLKELINQLGIDIPIKKSDLYELK
ncbi:DUF2971 domain-containing protein [Ancylomarina sp. 16SWW S1-10-2]|uniref:DUF2971 domain-containing protein n=1 Tax=Ancylomarina sp. 16SWW S1-10-2 TaxID=2499681 RepID=UPI0012ADD61E|nr:DUF2971 domain-containing protein [Ancylomarina sp. 16SWW S1-10-2]MRT93655.1 DUF2971 domain-containing protein [Ancylomarina sp. 16SWW S1-10-2]